MLTIVHSDYTPYHVFLLGIGGVIGGAIVLIALKLKLVPYLRARLILGLGGIVLGIILILIGYLSK